MSCELGVEARSVLENVVAGRAVMVGVYWALTLFWVIAVASLVTVLFVKDQLFTKRLKQLSIGFFVLAVLFLIDSLYWSLANSGRVGVLPKSIADALYNPWLIALVKSLFLVAAIVFMYMTRRKFVEAQRWAERLYFTRFVEQTSDAIGVLDVEGRVVYWNSGAELLYGHLRSDVVGRSIKDFLVPSSRHAEIDDVLAAIRRTGVPRRFEAPRLKADKSEVLVDITISPFEVEDSSFGGYFGIMREVSHSSHSAACAPSDGAAIEPRSAGRRLHVVVETDEHENCTIRAEHADLKSTNGFPIEIEVDLDYVMTTFDGTSVGVTELTYRSSPDASVRLDPAFRAGASYFGALRFQTETVGPVTVNVEYTAKHNFGLSAATMRDRFHTDPPDDYHYVEAESDWEEVVLEFYWPPAFRIHGKPWILSYTGNGRRRGRPVPIPYDSHIEERYWRFTFRHVKRGTRIVPYWRLADSADVQVVAGV